MSDTEIPHVGPVDPTRKTSRIDPDAPGGADQKQPGLCWYNGVQYSGGAQVCVGGVRLQCNGSGTWFPNGRC